MTDQTTIQCDCPRCGRVCGFKACYAGRTARCLSCDTRFVIPQHTGLPAAPCTEAPAAPLPGFYANAFKGSLKAFVQPQSIVGWVFCAALVTAHFLLGDVDLSITLPGFRLLLLVGWVVTLITFGCFAWYCMEIIVTTRLGLEFLPPVEPGAGFEFIWNVIKSCYLFVVSLVVALLPAAFIGAGLESLGIEPGRLFFLIVALCLLLWPMNLALIANEAPLWRVFRCNLLVAAIAKTFIPYLLTAVITVAAFFVLWQGMGYFASNEETATIAAIGLLAFRWAGAALFIFAMRIIGVYCLHYADLCPELWITPPPQIPGAA